MSVTRLTRRPGRLALPVVAREERMALLVEAHRRYGALPPVQTIAHRYGITFATLKDDLRALRDILDVAIAEATA